MSPIETLTAEPAVRAIGWSLVHFLWQGALVAGVLAMVLALAVKASASVRYMVACAALLLMAALPVATAWLIYRAEVVPPADVIVAREMAEVPAMKTAAPVALRADVDRGEAVSPAVSAPLTLSGRVERTLPWVFLIWMSGVALLSIRTVGGWLYTVRLRTSMTRPAADTCVRTLERLARRIGLDRTVRVLESAAVDVPTVIGCLRPIVLMPAAALTGLSRGQIEAILAHELAHIRRHDYLVNLLQTAVETLLFYHPATWWVSRRIRAEREHCCDDEAIAICGDAVGYARALASLETMRVRQAQLTMAAAGGSLLARVRRILGAPAPARGFSGSWAAVVAATVLFTAGAGLSQSNGPSVQGLGRTRAGDIALQTPPIPPVPPPPPAPPAVPALPQEPPPGPPVPMIAPVPPAPPVPAPAIGIAPMIPPPAVPAPPGAVPMIAPPMPPLPPSPAIAPVPMIAVPLPPSPAMWPVPMMAPPAPPAPPAPASVPVPPPPSVAPAPPVPPVPPEIDLAQLTDAERRAVEEARQKVAEARRELVAAERAAREMARQAVADATQRERAAARVAEVRARVERTERAAAERMAEAAARVQRVMERQAEDRAREMAVRAARTEERMRTAVERAAEQAARSEAGAVSQSTSRDNNSFSSSWSENGIRTEVKGRGNITFSDDARDIQSIAPGGLLRIIDRRQGKTRTLEVEPGADGRLQYKYTLDGREMPFEGEGRAWLTEFLPEFVRRTGIGAEGRVKHILQKGGPGAVLDEISLIKSDYVKGRYFRHLAEQATLDAPTVQRALAQAERDISSDYELASLLIAWAPKYVADDASRAAYVAAVNSISSDYERRRALTAVLTGGRLSAPVTRDMLAAAQKMQSDYELAELLRAVVTKGTIDDATAPAFFAAVKTMQSDYERRRVLAAVFAAAGQSPAVATGALDSAATMSSGYELAEFLVAVAQNRVLDGAVASSFFNAVSGMTSDYERHRVLSAVVARKDASADVLNRTLTAATAMHSGHELSGLLIEVIRTHGVDASLRPAFLKAAEQLKSEYEHGRVMSALSRAENR